MAEIYEDGWSFKNVVFKELSSIEYLQGMLWSIDDNMKKGGLSLQSQSLRCKLILRQ